MCVSHCTIVLFRPQRANVEQAAESDAVLVLGRHSGHSCTTLLYWIYLTEAQFPEGFKRRLYSLNPKPCDARTAVTIVHLEASYLNLRL